LTFQYYSLRRQAGQRRLDVEAETKTAKGLQSLGVTNQQTLADGLFDAGIDLILRRKVTEIVSLLR
jgi:hypothetical protein